ncbi:hypothetical protein JJB99_29860 [Bradyrhizobium diazoefficiens]|uniref:hypothetical protein n=1 Tax=Bradyrhizobium diazoefficiens TaxID=1355477 RepID=UPI00190D482A|nr:hypothetical protein [Bradyrhizobium diazoefficiens]QQO13566.1 hypothetical protein JJB99_29860 [Bradyrhizobium diazoefficiens]
MRSFLGVLALASSLTISAAPSFAADYAVPPVAVRHVSRVPYIDRGPNPYCGPRCGCPIVVHVRHRSLERYYPSSFDPRTKNDDPNYAYGRIRSYARFAHPAFPERVLEY